MSTTAKRCRVAAVLVLAVLLPDFRLLHTSQTGLAMIANFEGCRLRPYQCRAGVWTSGIGHTQGVNPRESITPHDAAVNLVADVLNVERAIAKCVALKLPQPIYDVLISFAFNVGSGAACKSTLVAQLKRGAWRQACDELTRWIYVKGVSNNGLKQRRQRERAYCLQGV